MGYKHNVSGTFYYIPATGYINGAQVNAISCTSSAATGISYFTTSLASAAGTLSNASVTAVVDLVRTLH